MGEAVRAQSSAASRSQHRVQSPSWTSGCTLAALLALPARAVLSAAAAAVAAAAAAASAPEANLETFHRPLALREDQAVQAKPSSRRLRDLA